MGEVRMRLFPPSRVVALVALAIAAVSLFLALGVASAGTSRPAKQACVNGPALVEREKGHAVAYYETAFNDKNPRLAVKLYGGDEYIQHNPLAANRFDAVHGLAERVTPALPDIHMRRL